VAPPSLQIGEDIIAHLDASNMEYEICDDFKKILPEVDAVYMTRIQDEWDTAEESRSLDTTPFHLTADHLSLMKKDSIIMHPLPRRNEIAIEVDDDPRAMYWRQVRNGMWIRAALMLVAFERDGEIDRYYDDLIR